MELTYGLLKSFAEVASMSKENSNLNGGNILTATGIIDAEGNRFVQFEGSDSLTPVVVGSEFVDGDIVSVQIENHVATVVNNISRPSITTRTAAWDENGNVTVLNLSDPNLVLSDFSGSLGTITAGMFTTNESRITYNEPHIPGFTMTEYGLGASDGKELTFAISNTGEVLMNGIVTTKALQVQNSISIGIEYKDTGLVPPELIGTYKYVTIIDYADEETIDISGNTRWIPPSLYIGGNQYGKKVENDVIVWGTLTVKGHSSSDSFGPAYSDVVTDRLEVASIFRSKKTDTWAGNVDDMGDLVTNGPSDVIQIHSSTLRFENFGHGIRWVTSFGDCGLAMQSTGENLIIYTRNTGSSSYASSMHIIEGNQVNLVPKTGGKFTGRLSFVASSNDTDGKTRYGITTGSESGQLVSRFWSESASKLNTYCQNGSTTAYATHSITMSSSDIRLKDNIHESKVDALTVLNRIPMYSFDWNDGRKDPHQKIGFIADYLERFDAKLVSGGGYDEDGNMIVKSVDDFYLLGYVVKGIQELYSIVDSNTSKWGTNDVIISNLYDRITKLENLINTLAS